MTAAAASRRRKTQTLKSLEFTLKSGNKAYKGARAAIELATRKVVPLSAAAGLLPIGSFAADVDATSADKIVVIDFDREITVEWFANATASDAVAATDLYKMGYFADDQTVAITPAHKQAAGRIWLFDSTKNLVAVEATLPVLAAVVPEALAGTPAAGSYTSNDYAPADIVNGDVYDVPTTGAASTITLPAAAADGTVAYFAADGIKNGHTVTYRDATGPTNLTTALTASKRHLVVVAKRGGKWFANAYVAP